MQRFVKVFSAPSIPPEISKEKKMWWGGAHGGKKRTGKWANTPAQAGGPSWGLIFFLFPKVSWRVGGGAVTSASRGQVLTMYVSNVRADPISRYQPWYPKSCQLWVCTSISKHHFKTRLFVLAYKFICCMKYVWINIFKYIDCLP